MRTHLFWHIILSLWGFFSVFERRRLDNSKLAHQLLIVFILRREYIIGLKRNLNAFVRSINTHDFSLLSTLFFAYREAALTVFSHIESCFAFNVGRGVGLILDVQERCSLARFKSTLGLYLANEFSLEMIGLVLIMIVFIYRSVFIVNSNVIVHTTTMDVVGLIAAILRCDPFVLKLIVAAPLVKTGRVRMFLQLNIRVAFFLSLVAI